MTVPDQIESARPYTPESSSDRKTLWFIRGRGDCLVRHSAHRGKTISLVKHIVLLVLLFSKVAAAAAGRSGSCSGCPSSSFDVMVGEGEEMRSSRS